LPGRSQAFRNEWQHLWTEFAHPLVPGILPKATCQVHQINHFLRCTGAHDLVNPVLVAYSDDWSHHGEHLAKQVPGLNVDQPEAKKRRSTGDSIYRQLYGFPGPRALLGLSAPANRSPFASFRHCASITTDQ
jgi:hypothetical protein